MMPPNNIGTGEGKEACGWMAHGLVIDPRMATHLHNGDIEHDVQPHDAWHGRTLIGQEQT